MDRSDMYSVDVGNGRWYLKYTKTTSEDGFTYYWQQSKRWDIIIHGRELY